MTPQVSIDKVSIDKISKTLCPELCFPYTDFPETAKTGFPYTDFPETIKNNIINNNNKKEQYIMYCPEPEDSAPDGTNKSAIPSVHIS